MKGNPTPKLENTWYSPSWIMTSLKATKVDLTPFKFFWKISLYVGRNKYVILSIQVDVCTVHSIKNIIGVNEIHYFNHFLPILVYLNHLYLTRLLKSIFCPLSPHFIIRTTEK